MGYAMARCALMASAAVAFVGTGTVMAQDLGRAPISGTVTLDAGFTPDPKIVSVTSGGRHDTSRSIGGTCTGFVSGAPDVRVNYRTASTVPLIFSVEAEGDTTLAINGPDGRWYCNDDSDGLNPAIRFDRPNTGNYQVWIGTFGGREQIPARLFISEIDNTPPPPPPPPPQAYIDPSLAPTYGTLTLSAGFTNDPRTVQVTSGGTVAGSTIAESCSGTFAGASDVRVNYTSGSLPLILSVDADSDTTLMVQDPRGDWYCDDDGGVESLNPSIRFDKPTSGIYSVWIGSYSSGGGGSATLYVSELSSQ